MHTALKVAAVATASAALALQVIFPGAYGYIPGTIALAISFIGLIAAFGRAALVAVTFSGSTLVGTYLYKMISGWTASLATNEYITPADLIFLDRVVASIPVVIAMGLVAVTSFSFQEQKSPIEKNPVNLPSLGRKKAFDIRLGSAYIPKNDRYLHSLVIGTTGTGKTSRVLKPMIYQDLENIAAGNQAGLTVIEPKGDLAADVAEIAKSFGLPVTFINPEDSNTPIFNPMEGNPHIVAEITRTVLQALFGKQEAFFRQAQETAAKNTVLLLKEVRGDNVTMTDLARVLQDQELMKQYVERLTEKQGGRSALTQFFTQEMLNPRSDMHKHILGLRLQLEDITGNDLLNRVLIGRSEVNLDEHLETGGILVINTAMGRLARLGDLFGQFAILHFQHAVFRRPGDENTRTPHFLYVDEAPRYMNPEFDILLTIGRSYRCATLLSLQNTAQMLLDQKPAFRDIVLENCRNKFTLNLGSSDDAKRFAAELGETESTKTNRTYKREAGPFIIPWMEDSIRQSEDYEARVNYTDLMEMPQFHCAYRTVIQGRPQRPGMTKLELCPWDKKRQRRPDAVVSGMPEKAPHRQQESESRQDIEPKEQEREAAASAVEPESALLPWRDEEQEPQDLGYDLMETDWPDDQFFPPPERVSLGPDNSRGPEEKEKKISRESLSEQQRIAFTETEGRKTDVNNGSDKKPGQRDIFNENDEDEKIYI